MRKKKYLSLCININKYTYDKVQFPLRIIVLAEILRILYKLLFKTIDFISMSYK